MPISQGNSPNKKIIGNKLPKKRDRKAYSAQRYQVKKQEYHERYLKKKAEKEQQEKELANKLVEQKKQGETYEKDIELAKFHEERGKIKCSCYGCEAKINFRF